MFEKKKTISKKIMQGTVSLFPYTVGQVRHKNKKKKNLSN